MCSGTRASGLTHSRISHWTGPAGASVRRVRKGGKAEDKIGCALCAYVLEGSHDSLEEARASLGAVGLHWQKVQMDGEEHTAVPERRTGSCERQRGSMLGTTLHMMLTRAV